MSGCSGSDALSGSLCTSLVAAIGWVLPVATVAEEEDRSHLQRVTITGSHVARIDTEAALPVRVIRREEIERSGAVTLEGLLQHLPANVNAVNEAMSVRNVTNPGISSANLRGLTPGSTLVLLDGRRLANYAFDGESVDLNSIPLAAIDRVEVLADGASAIYGSDAIGGVINVILRKDFVGAQISGGGRFTEKGGGGQRQAGFDAGFGDLGRDGYNVFASLSHQRQDRLASQDRDFARTAQRLDIGLDRLIGATFPASIVDRPRFRILNPVEPTGCMPPLSLPYRPFPFFTPSCGMDPAIWTDLLPKTVRTSALVRANVRLGENLELFGEALLSRHRSENQTPPMSVLVVPTPGAQLPPSVYPAGGPYYPTDFATTNGLSGDLVIASMALDLGPRLNTVKSHAQRYVAGLRGRQDAWDFNLAVVRSLNDQEHHYGGGWLYTNRYIAALRTGLINPWGPSAPEGQALLASTVFNGMPQSAHAATTQVTAVASRPLVALAAGEMILALGLEGRFERLSYVWDPEVLLSGFSPAFNAPQSKSGHRDLQAMHAELSVPLARGLETMLALRHDRYSDVGATTNPKIAVRWQPDPRWLLRGSWGTGFRAPPLYLLDAPPGVTLAVGGRADPVRCPVTGTANDCAFVVQAYAGGNPGLQPETSEQRSAGFVWQPAKAISVGVDYWRVQVDGAIAPLEVENVFRYFDRFSGRFARGPADAAYPDLPGPIIGLDLSPINLGTTLTSGIDAAAQWSMSTPSGGRAQVALNATYVDQYDTQIDGVRFVSALGSAAHRVPVPRWRGSLSLDWTQAGWGVTVSSYYMAGYRDQLPGADGSPRRVRSNSTWDLQVRLDAFAGQRWIFGVQNLFDTNPPSSNQNRSAQAGFNPQLSSPLGRTYYLRGTYTLR
jgi:iron complex outermembrane receptor protein